MNLSEKIIALRKQQGWSQEALAEHLGVSRLTVSQWESSASEPELACIIQLCSLFGVTADALIRDDLDLDGSAAPADRKPRLSLQDAYAYLAEYQVAARKIALGSAVCTASPALLVAFAGLSEFFCLAVGMPALFLMIAFGVWTFINAGAITSRFRHIDKRRFSPAPGVTEWACSAREQFRPSLVKDVATGVALCVLSPAAIMLFAGIGDLLWYDGDAGACFGTGVMIAIIAAGVYMIVRSCTIRSCYQRLLNEKDV